MLQTMANNDKNTLILLNIEMSYMLNKELLGQGDFVSLSLWFIGATD